MPSCVLAYEIRLHCVAERMSNMYRSIRRCVAISHCFPRKEPDLAKFSFEGTAESGGNLHQYLQPCLVTKFRCTKEKKKRDKTFWHMSHSNAMATIGGVRVYTHMPQSSEPNEAPDYGRRFKCGEFWQASRTLYYLVAQDKHECIPNVHHISPISTLTTLTIVISTHGATAQYIEYS